MSRPTPASAGLGESGTWGHLAASRAAIETFAAHLVGEDPGPIERHWNLMHRFSHFQGAAINGAVAAIDIALWDIKGKALGVPVHSLLGGPCRTHARVYGHAYGKTTDELVENCVALRRRASTRSAISIPSSTSARTSPSSPPTWPT